MNLHRNFMIALLLAVQSSVIPISLAHAENADTTLARQLIDRFYDDLTPDKKALAAFLGDGFQIIGSDGLHFDRGQYLDLPVTITDHTISDIVARRDDDILTATFSVSYHGNIEGTDRDVPHLSRLAVFRQKGGDWKIQAFAALGTGVNDVDAEAVTALAGFYGAVTSGDPARLRAVLAPDYQVQRANGVGYTFEEYFKRDMPRVSHMPSLTKIVATSFNNTMVTRYMLSIEETIDGKPVVALAPRLTVFQRINGKWLVSAHANFGAQTK